jgi:cyclopropane-fatty-acyl-phospholipid synthase
VLEAAAGVARRVRKSRQKEAAGALRDIGCSWGALVKHAADHYGVQAVGITISVLQADVARERLREAGHRSLSPVEVSDYRDIDHEQQYDKIVSVGMLAQWLSDSSCK